jgi:hypothetical protein
MRRQHRYTAAERSERRAEALGRATTGTSWANYPAIIQGFAERGIPVDQILPRENVFTYGAWAALNRFVRKGEHGVSVLTWIEGSKERLNQDTGKTESVGYKFPRSTVVFHVSQTERRAEVRA